MMRNNESNIEKNGKTTNASTVTDTTAWDLIQARLFPGAMIGKLPENEQKSCDMLVDAIANSPNCWADSGDAVARFGDFFELVFRIQVTLMKRYKWHRGRLIKDQSSAYLHPRRGSFRRPIVMEVRPALGSLGHMSSQIGCVWGEGGDEKTTVMHDCVGFVQWADSGFEGFGNLSTSLAQYQMKTTITDMVDQIRVRSYSLSWHGLMGEYERARAHFEKSGGSDFEWLARLTILEWSLFPERSPFERCIEDVSTEEVARKIFEEFEEDRRYQ